MPAKRILSTGSPIWRWLFLIIQCTWGGLQTLMGLVLYILYFNFPHDWYHGCLRTRWNSSSGISLGLFIFTPNPDPLKPQESPSAYARRQDLCDRIAVHEFGHTLQSIMLGPLYLVIIGIPSFIWARSSYFRQRRRQYHIPYSSLWTERWANTLGEAWLKRPAIRN